MSSPADICNMALSHIGVDVEIANLDTDVNKNAKACRRFYEKTVEACLRDFAWDFASKTVALELIEESPNDEWAYSYSIPNDCLMTRRILSGSRVDTEASKVKYKEVKGGVLYTDKQDAELEYTTKNISSDDFSPDFELALSYRLAAYIAPRLAREKGFELSDLLQKKYDNEIERARANMQNGQSPDEDPDSEFISVRG